MIYTIRYCDPSLQIKEMYSTFDYLFDNLWLIEAKGWEYKVLGPGISFTQEQFGWGDMTGWVQRFKHEPSI